MTSKRELGGLKSTSEMLVFLTFVAFYDVLAHLAGRGSSRERG